MKTPSRASALRFRLLCVLLLVSLGAAPASAAQAQGPAPVAAPQAGSSAQTATTLKPVEEAYVLLLRRYALPLEPADLANAAQDGMVAALKEAGVASPAPGLSVPGNDPQQQWMALRQRYLALAATYGDVLPANELAYAAIRGMTASVDDAHTNFISPTQFDEEQRWERGEVHYGGIGARMRGPIPTVVEVFDDAPAQRAGLRPGDVLVAVNGQTTTDMRLDEVINLVRGPEGTPVVLSVQRAASDRVDELTLVRASIAMPFVQARRLPGDVGYVQLRGFPEPSVIAGVENAIVQQQREGVRGIIFDLRGNGGGRLDVGSRLLARFVPDGPIYQSVDRQGNEETANVRDAHPILTVPLVVLIDEGTASMGEVFAAAIQEHHIGRLVGTTTAGAVAASVFVPLSDGSALQLSVEQVYSGGGALLDRVGVHPDDEVELDLDELRQGRDAQLERALDYLRAQAAAPAPAPVAARR
jgi:carboxyl-terminal processing protease